MAHYVVVCESGLEDSHHVWYVFGPDGLESEGHYGWVWKIYDSEVVGESGICWEDISEGCSESLPSSSEARRPIVRPNPNSKNY